ncbi:hypothetical protein AAEO50_02495 [Rossellomorea oryzaecorticis]|uniref:Uncharacterized protein n=1 Tax=Rossellomorea oryzaecorticis TaxID=1396505 RepID=A0ABU9K6S8_9BACI
MFGETLPAWFWAMYYLFFLTVLVASIFSFVKKKHKGISGLAILFTLTIPVVGFMNSIGRAQEMNEFEHLVSQLQDGAVWSYFTVLGYLFLVVWFGFFLFKNKNNRQVI